MGKFVAALVVLELFCGIQLSYEYSFTDGQDRLYDLNGFGYDNFYPLHRYNSIEPYGGNSYSNQGIFGGSGYSNLGTNRGSRGSVNNNLYGGSSYRNLGTNGGSRGSVYNAPYGGIGYSSLGTYGGSGGSVYNTLYGGSGYGNLGTYGGSGGSVYNNLHGGSGGGSGYNSLWTYLSDNSRLGKYQFGGYNSLNDIDDFGLGDSLLRYSSLGSSLPRSTDNLGSHNYIGGYSNLEPDLFGGYNTGHDVDYSIYTPSSFLRADTYSPKVYNVGNQKLRRRPRNRSTYK